MEHKILPAFWKSKKALVETIKSHEMDGWSVAALGKVFGGLLLVLTKDGTWYEHEFVPVMMKTPNKVKDIIAEKEEEAWQVCAIGECFTDSLMILKRQKS